LKKKPLTTGSQYSEAEMQKLIHELEVKQTELTIRNKELMLTKDQAVISKDIYTELYDFAPSGYFTLSTKGEIIELNLRGSQMLGKERLRLKNSSFNFFVSDDTKPIFNLFLEKVFISKTKEHCEVTLSANGNIQTYVHLSGITTENGVQCLVIAVDISERKRAEQEIKLKNEELLKINAEKDKFFSIIAHDLRSPFNGFLGLTQIMAEKLPDMTLDEIQEIAVTMRNSADNLYSLLENLLEWSLMQRGLTTFAPKLFLLMPKISGCMALALEAANKEIEICYDVPEDLTIFADGNMLESVIRNLFSNAVKFTPRGGKILIAAKELTDKSIEISIKDTGIGMTKETIHNLFRLDINTSREGTEGESSTGLGLIICKDFIEKHGGTLHVESEEEKGSVFYFTIPYNAG
jgi:PAS domain S-box-containing protein